MESGGWSSYACGNSYVMEKGARAEAVRSSFDGGVSSEFNAQIKKQWLLLFKLWEELRQNSSLMMRQQRKQNARLQWKQQEPFVVWLELAAFALILMGNWSKITTKTRQGKGTKWKQILNVDGRGKINFETLTVLVVIFLSRHLWFALCWRDGSKARNPTGLPILTGRI